MDPLSLRRYCLQKKRATDDLPFGEDALVIKVANKMFALIMTGNETPSVNLKCDPALALELRRKYPVITPGYHMNKQHWNTVLLDGNLPEEQILQMVDHSYDLVVKGLKKSDRDLLESL
ncbi:MAG: MmcQ/YjbR family DNA-binding protein [Chloroflexi bacterium]|jgi:predicted DNA-binding protein (MmcQ/YjbR family)|nr:MmcQ/YjbR family DNA-binding protein [Chloroflexota bacterium]